MDLFLIVQNIAPSYNSVQNEIEEIIKSNPKKSKDEIANIYGDRLIKNYTSIGVVSALPSAIPGIGTAVQVATEVASVSGDLLLMLRWMSAMCYGVAFIYEKDIQSDFSKEFIKILGLWCGALKVAKDSATRIGTKVAIVQFNKQVSGKVFQKINQKVGTTIITKFGAKRGGIAIGKLIPFGIGAVVGGGFNYFTMNGFKRQAIDYYKTDEINDYLIIES
ncbi:hypothetical protein [Chryseobacterium sp.]|uniref:hypothetical protein n=1 Tax=Chryseobacterium sp. TaxID=1871047 RepID=UPI0012A7E3A8|nr:hypothetical protein [Chryseobacterium sp.]QFG52959.1 hypothetical protein F7R58_05150 [Chryseobacterium sp.]